MVESIVVIFFKLNNKYQQHWGLGYLFKCDVCLFFNKPNNETHQNLVILLKDHH